MKKFISIFLFLSLLIVPIHSGAVTIDLSKPGGIMTGSGGSIAVYTGTITGLRISAVDGTAFIDAANTDVLNRTDGNHLIEIYDSSGRMISGYLKAQGTAETLGAALFEDACAADGTANWTAVDSIAFDTDHYELTRNGASGEGRNAAAFAAASSGTLLKAVVTVKDGSVASATCGLRYRNAEGTTIRQSSNFFTTAGFVANPYYSTSSNNERFAGLVIASNINGNIEFKLFGVYPVTAPSTSGATIVNAKGGTTYNWFYKNASFTYNAASYYVIVKKVR